MPKKNNERTNEQTTSHTHSVGILAREKTQIQYNIKKQPKKKRANTIKMQQNEYEDEKTATK